MIAEFWQRHGFVRHLAISTVVAALLTAALTLLPRENFVQGVITDLTVASRALVFGVKPLTDARVVVIGMDQRSLDSAELVTRPRVLFTPVYTEIAEKSLAHGGRGVLFDIIIAYDAHKLEIGDPVTTGTGDQARTRPNTPLRRYDNDFLKLLRKHRKTGQVVIGRSVSLGPARRFQQMAGPLGQGLVTLSIQSGNIIRAVPTGIPNINGEEQVTLAGRALDLFGAKVDAPVHILPPAPLDSLPSVSMIDVMRCKDEARLDALFNDRIVLVGGMLPNEDRLKTADRFIPRDPPPVQPETGDDPCAFVPPHTRDAGPLSLPGVYLHAGAVDGVMSGWAPRSAPDWVGVSLLAGVGFITVLLSLMLRPTLGALALLGFVPLAFMAGVVALEMGWFLQTAPAVVAVPLGFVATSGIRLGLLDRRANTIRREFGRYLSPILVQQMIETGHAPELGGEERDVTVLFADLSGFTAISETLESAELTKVLNRYLDRIAGVIRDQGGYVDKFIGDAVMAIWNAPAPVENHGLAATEAAYLINTAVESMGSQDRAKGLPAFTVKVGISSGSATVGNVGAQDRMNYTVIGETVNLAARFESLPGLFKTPIVIGPRTAEMVIDHFVLLPIVAIQVKGKTNGVRVFAPILRRGTMLPAIMESLEDYAIALSAFEEGEFETAAELWSSLAERAWPGAGPAGAMAEEARFMQKQLLLTPWNGVLEARSK